MPRLVAILLLPLIFATSALQAPTSGCVVAGADLPAALAEAQAAPARCLEIPAGEYVVPAYSSDWLLVTADGFDLYGAGEGITTIRVTDGLTLTRDLHVITLKGANQHVHDLTIRNGDAAAGPAGVGGVLIGDTSSGAIVDRVEFTGGLTTRGYGVGTYRLYSAPGGPGTWATIRNISVHDTGAMGIGINSSHNTVENNRLVRVGVTTLDHGIYAQGGYNVYSGNYIETAKGYSIHGYKHVPSLDSSGDRIVNNTSINPGVGHIIVDSITANGAQLDRSAVISGNVLRSTGGPAIGINVNSPAIVSDNVLEDVGAIGGRAIYIGGVGAGSIVRGNRLIGTRSSSNGIQADVAALISGNSIDSTGIGVGINIGGAGTRVSDNRIVLVGAQGSGVSGIGVNAPNAVVLNNDVTITAPGACLKAYSSATGLIARGNILTSIGGAWYQDVPQSLAGAVLDNVQR